MEPSTFIGSFMLPMLATALLTFLLIPGLTFLLSKMLKRKVSIGKGLFYISVIYIIAITIVCMYPTILSLEPKLPKDISKNIFNIRKYMTEHYQFSISSVTAALSIFFAKGMMS